MKNDSTKNAFRIVAFIVVILMVASAINQRNDINDLMQDMRDENDVILEQRNDFNRLEEKVQKNTARLDCQDAGGVYRVVDKKIPSKDLGGGSNTGIGSPIVEVVEGELDSDAAWTIKKIVSIETCIKNGTPYLLEDGDWSFIKTLK